MCGDEEDPNKGKRRLVVKEPQGVHGQGTKTVKGLGRAQSSEGKRKERAGKEGRWDVRSSGGGSGQSLGGRRPEHKVGEKCRSRTLCADRKNNGHKCGHSNMQPTLWK